MLTPIEEQYLDEAKDFVIELLSKDTSGHDYHHIRRVVKNAKELLAEEPKADEFVTLMAAWLHDVDDPKISQSVDKRAALFLSSLEVSLKIVERILEIVENISFSKQKNSPKELSLEGKIVQDADRLDALGAIGIARTFAYGGSKGRPIYLGDDDDDSSLAHFHQKLLKLVDLMNTDKAKEIAKKRHELMLLFVNEFYQEWQ